MSDDVLNNEKAQFREFLAKVDDLAQRTEDAIERTESLMNDADDPTASQQKKSDKDGEYHWHNQPDTPDSGSDCQNAPDKRGPGADGA